MADDHRKASRKLHGAGFCHVHGQKRCEVVVTTDPPSKRARNRQARRRLKKIELV
jgi:hypothetical protein